MADRTKKLLAQKIQELAKHKPVREIQIKELCKACEIERTTFYYHFRDKYDLICWIFEQNFETESRNATSLNSEEMIYHMCCRLLKQKAFFANALADHSQNNLRQYMLDFYICSEREILCEYLKVDRLDEETEYALCNYSYGCMGHTIAWLQGESTYSAERFAHYQYKFMPEVLKKAFISQQT